MAEVIKNADDFSKHISIRSTEIDSFAIVATSLRAFKFVHNMQISGDHQVRWCQNKKVIKELDLKFNYEIGSDDCWYEFTLCNSGEERTLVLYKVKGRDRHLVDKSHKKFFLHVSIQALLRLHDSSQSRISNGSYIRYVDMNDISEIKDKCGNFKIYTTDQEKFCNHVDQILQENNVLNAMDNRVFFYRFQHGLREERIGYKLDLLSGEANVMEEMIDKEACQKMNLLACFQVHYAVNFFPKMGKGGIFFNKSCLSKIFESNNLITCYNIFGLTKLCHFSGYSKINALPYATYAQTYSNFENAIRYGRNVSFTAYRCLLGHTYEDFECQNNPESLLDLRIETTAKFLRTKQFLLDAAKHFDLRFEVVLTSTDAQGPSKMLRKWFKCFAWNGLERTDDSIKKTITDLLVDNKCLVYISDKSLEYIVSKVSSPKFNIIAESYTKVENYDLICKELTALEINDVEDPWNQSNFMHLFFKYICRTSFSMPTSSELQQLYVAEVGLRYILRGTTKRFIDTNTLNKLKEIDQLNTGTIISAAQISSKTDEFKDISLENLYNVKTMDDFPNNHYYNAMQVVMWFMDSEHYESNINNFQRVTDALIKSCETVNADPVNYHSWIKDNIKDTYRKLIRYQLNSFLIMLARHCILYNGLKNCVFQKETDCFKKCMITNTNCVKGATITVEAIEKRPSVEHVVQSLLSRRNHVKLTQFARSLCIPRSRFHGSVVEKNENKTNIYETICQVYQKEMGIIVQAEMQVIPANLLNENVTNPYRWTEINKLNKNNL